MLVVTAPQLIENYERSSIFLGGAITGAGGWQEEAIKLLAGSFNTCFNPRRPEGFVAPDQPEYLESYTGQVQWEHQYLLAADVVLFWLPKDALAITTRFEIGWFFGMQFCSASFSKKRFVVGIEPEVNGSTYYNVVLPKIGVSIHNTLAETCNAAISIIV